MSSASVTPAAFLRVGDAIFLVSVDSSEGEGGFVSARRGQLGVCSSPTPPASFSHESVFVVKPQQNYVAARKLKAMLEQENKTAEQMAADPALMAAQAAVEREEEMNRASFSRIAGREVRYGQVVQLHHAVTDVPVAVGRQAALLNREGRRVVESEAAGDAAWFRVMPRLRIQSEGERVRLGDPIVLEHVQTSLRLRVERAGRMPDGRREVSATLEKAALRVSLYRPHGGAGEDADAPRPLFGGEAVRLVYEEEDGFLAAIASDLILKDLGGRLVPVVQAAVAASEQRDTTVAGGGAATAALVAADSHDDASLDTMWSFLNADITSGAALRWGGRVWIAHAPSGRALGVAGGGTAEEEGMAVGTIQLSPDEPAAQRRGLFELVPLDAASSGAVAADSLFRLRHVDSGRWIHFVRTGSDAGAREKRPSLSEMSAKVTRASVAREEVEAAGAYTKLLVAGALSATVASVDDNVVSLQRVPLEHYSDCLRSGEWLAALRTPSDPKALGRVAGELIRFVTVSDNPDPLTREGLPHAARQLILRQRGVLDLVLAAAEAPLTAAGAEGAGSEPSVPSKAQQELSRSASSMATGALPSSVKEMKRALTLCMVLFRHLLRGHDANKDYAMRFVPRLQLMLGLGIRSAGALTEVFLENESVLKLVTDKHVAKFISLIREVGRQARYTKFLTVLCQCGGLPIRVNQWRICKMLVHEAPELLTSLKLEAGRVLVSGDRQYFPVLGQVGGSMELVEWLAHCPCDDTVGYFESCLGLFAALAEGRNLRNAPALSARLPYPLLEAMAKDERLRAVQRGGKPLGLAVAARATAILRSLYVDAEPHQFMARVKHVRIWEKVPEAAQAGALSSRLTTKVDISWDQFNPLKAFIARHIGRYFKMDAAAYGENRLVLELLRTLHALLKLGFYFSSELAPLLPTLLGLLDGRDDTVGPQDKGSSGKRYRRKVTIHVDTVAIMDCKLEVCRILQLLCDVRLDLRLSRLLALYHDEFAAGLWEPSGEQPQPRDSLGGTRGKLQAIGATMRALVVRDDDGAGSGYARLEEGEGGRSSLAERTMAVIGAQDAARSREAAFKKLFELLGFGATEMLVGVLMDLTFYEHPQLVSAALGLLVRQFEQRQKLLSTTLHSQLLVKPLMVSTYSTFDELLRRLSQLASRRKLYDDELFETACLLGKLVAHCSEESNSDGAELRSAGGFSRTRTARSRAGTTRTASSRTDHTEGKYLILIGKGYTAVGSDAVRIELADHRPPRPGERLQLEKEMYSVKTVSPPTDGVVEVALDRPLKVVGALAPELQIGGSGEVWVMLLCQSAGYNLDMQVLLRTMGAHEAVLQLLRLPVSSAPLPSELRTRAVLRAVYRTIKALVTGFPQMQSDLVPAIPRMVEHVEKDLVAYDVTPTGCVTAILRDNRAACARVPFSAIHKFVQLAAKKQAPRFLRFLGEICRPAGVAIKRNCQLVAQALGSKEEALLLFNSTEGMEERAALIAARDLETNPRGKLAYHIEAVGLLGTLVTGINNPNIEQMVRETLPMDDVVANLLLPDLPTPLVVSYLRLLDEAYLVTAKPLVNDLATRDFMELLSALQARIAAFVSRIEAADDLDALALDADSEEAAAEAEETDLLLGHVFPLLTHFFAPPRDAMEDSDEAETQGVGGLSASVLLLLAGYEDGRDEPFLAVFRALGETTASFRALECAAVLSDPVPVVDCLRALASGAFATLGDADLGTASSQGGGLSTIGVTVTLTADKEEAHPQAELPRFAAVFETAVAAGSEFNALVRIFSDGLDAAHEHELQQQRRGKKACDLPPAAQYARSLLDQLLAAAAAPAHPVDRGLTVASLKVLVRLLDIGRVGSSANEGFVDADHNKVNDADEALLRRRQKQLTEQGAARVALMMGACADDEYCRLGLQLGIELLRGGNSLVQQEMYHVLKAGDARAFDGSGSSWMPAVKARLRRGIKEIDERKMYLALQAERRAMLPELTAGLTAAAALAVTNDVEAPFQTQAFVAEALEMLSLLCEGHNVQMQDYLRDPREGQDSAVEAVDLVIEVHDLLVQLEPSLDESNVEQAILCIDCLTEFVQGNTSLGNMASLIESKASDAMERLVCRQRFEGVPADAVSRLRTSVSTWFLAMLEGEGTVAEERFLRTLDLERLSAVAATAYMAGSTAPSAAAGDADDDAESRERAMAAGYSLSTLIKHLHDYEEHAAFVPRAGSHGGSVVTSRSLGAFDAEGDAATAAAKRAMAGAIGRCEIVGASGKLERVYFRVPEFCNSLTRESKDELLWNVDRETPGRQIQELFARSQDLEFEMRHQHSLSRLPFWSIVTDNRSVFDFLVLRLAFIQNAIILIRFSLDPQHATPADAAGADESDAVERALSEFDLAGPGLNATDGEAAHPPSPLAAYLVIVAVTLFAAVAPVLLAWRDTSRSPRDKARVTASAAAVAAVIGGAGNYLVEHWEWFSELYAWALTLSPVEALELVERAGLQLIERLGSPEWIEAEGQINHVLGGLQCLSCVVVFSIYAVQNGPIRARRGLMDASGLPYEEVVARPEWRLFSLVMGPVYALTDPKLVLLAAMFGAAYLGINHSPLWFSVHLLDIVNKSADLQNVLRAVTENGRSIAMTALFGAIIIYLFAVVGFAVERDIFVLGNFPDEDLPMCTNLFNCFLNALNEGLRSGDIGSFMDPPVPGDHRGFAFRFVYQLSFWAIVITVLLNVIFGIIIDTFAELRASHQATKANMENNCFICGLDRFTLDSKGPGFEEHVEEDHNLWTYIFLMCYLRSKDPTMLNGWEQYVLRLMRDEDASFFPSQNALRLAGSGGGGGEDSGGGGGGGGGGGSGIGPEDLKALSDGLVAQLGVPLSRGGVFAPAPAAAPAPTPPVTSPLGTKLRSRPTPPPAVAVPQSPMAPQSPQGPRAARAPQTAQAPMSPVAPPEPSSTPVRLPEAPPAPAAPLDAPVPPAVPARGRGRASRPSPRINVYPFRRTHGQI